MPITDILDLPLGKFQTWHMKDVYLGPSSTNPGRSVPTVDDLVFQYNPDKIWKVVAVDDSGVTPSYVPTLELFNLVSSETSAFDDDIDVYQPSNQERIFLDTSVTPYELQIDDRYIVTGSEVDYYKLFRGTDITPSGEIISQVYNGSGTLIGENGGLELVDPANPSRKRTIPVKTGTTMDTGELVSAVFYTQAGVKIGVHRFIVVNSTAIRAIESNQISIVDIELVTTLLDSVETDLVLVPPNVTVTGGDFQARLTRSDGSTSLISVDGVKCKLLGLNHFNTSTSGITNDITLVYYPGPTESVINATNSALIHIASNYRIRTDGSGPAFGFKIFAVPKFNQGTGLYEIDYYLNNLKHEIMIKLDPADIIVVKTNGSQPDYSQSNAWQTLVLTVVIEDVIPVGYTGFTHIQTLTIKLGPVSLGLNSYWLDYKNDLSSVYGPTTLFTFNNGGLHPMSLKSGTIDVTDWLELLYYPLQPIWDTDLSLVPEEPTHFKLVYANTETAHMSVATEWDMLHNHAENINWVDNEFVEIIWYKEDIPTGGYYILAIGTVKLQGTLI